jgi:hypothetical protein
LLLCGVERSRKAASVRAGVDGRDNKAGHDGKRGSPTLLWQLRFVTNDDGNTIWRRAPQRRG